MWCYSPLSLFRKLRTAEVPLFAIAAFSIAFHQPAMAQDGSEAAVRRTPETAQQFLAEFFGKAPIKATVPLIFDGSTITPELLGEGHPPDQFTTADGTAAWFAVDRCHSRIDVNGAAFELTDGSSRAVPPLQYQIDWGKITAVAASETGLVILWGPAGTASLPRLNIGRADEAQRVKFAMEYLRTECAFKSDTGF